MTLLKDLLQVHEDALKEKDVQSDVDNDKMVVPADKETDDTPPAAVNKKDEEGFKICMDESLFMRLMEFAREEVKNDIQLHKVVSQIEVLMGSSECLNMDHYEDIVGGKAAGEKEDADADKEEASDDETAPADKGSGEEE